MATTADSWKPIEGYPRYQIDEFGSVWNPKTDYFLKERYGCRDMGPGFNLMDEDGVTHYVETSELIRTHFPNQ